MKQKLILHVGLHKTGTSFLQRAFAENLDALRAAGIEPAGGFDPAAGNHHPLIRAIKDEGPDALFSALRGKEGTVLVSSEALSHWSARLPESEVKAFSDRLRRDFDPTVVLFLRRQDFLLESVYAEVASHWFVGPIQREPNYYYDFEGFTERLEGLFGEGTLRICLYRDDLRKDILSEFLQLAGIPLDLAGLKVPPRQRVSLHRRKVALLSKVRMKPLQAFRQLRNRIEASPDIRDDGFKYQMSPKERLRFLRRHHDSNRAFAARRGLSQEDTDYLTSDALDERPWEPMAALDASEVAFVRTALAESGMEIADLAAPFALGKVARTVPR